MRDQFSRQFRGRERGVTLLIVAVAMLSMFAMAALAIDVVTLYVAEGETRRAADAAALAAAKVFVSSGFTSGQLGPPSSGTTQSLVCNGSTGFSDLEAQAVVNQNKIGGATASTVTTSCTFSQPENPQITVTVRRGGLPTFFARIWGITGSHVSATARAEAYNPSGQTVPIQVGSVKPWLVPNCDPSHTTPANANCAGGAAYFLDPATNYGIANSGFFIGTQLTLQEITPGTSGLVAASNYYAIDIPITASSASCPNPSAIWGTCGPVDSTAPSYFETIACANSVQLACGMSTGQSLSVDPGSGTTFPTHQAAMCLIHANNFSPPPNQGQDTFNVTGIGAPTTVTGGDNNPDTSLRGVSNISRSDSIVTVPLWDGTNLCPSGPCTSFNIVGFMQLGIQAVRKPSKGVVDAVILNVSGCGSATGGTPISGGGVSPIPVRLIQ